MAEIALISPSMNFERSMGVYAPLMEAAPPIGIARLAAVCEAAGWSVSIVDAYSERLTPEQTVARLERNPPDVVGVSCLTPSAAFVGDALSLVRSRMPRTRIALGNVHADVFAGEYLESGLADAVVHGEGERALEELVAVWGRGGSTDENTRGVSIMAGGKAVRTAPRPMIEDLDSLPVPSWNLTPYRLYGLLPFVTMAKPALTIEGSRGCPNRCSFCSLHGTGGRYRMFSAERIVDEIVELVKKYGARQIAFADAMFPLTESQGVEFCETLMKRIPPEERVLWVTETRADVLTEKLARKMKEAGCGRLLLGIESGSDETLRLVNKNLKVEKARTAVQTCRRAGIQACGFFIIGLPGETRENAEKTLRFALELPLDVAKFNIAIPYPGSAFFNELREAGGLRHTRWEDYTCYVSDPEQLPWINENWTAAGIVEFQRRAVRLFYLRIGIIFRHLFVIRSVRPWHLLVGGWILISSFFRKFRRQSD